MIFDDNALHQAKHLFPIEREAGHEHIVDSNHLCISSKYSETYYYRLEASNSRLRKTVRELDA